MPKTKTKKSTKPQCKCKFKCCPLTGILIILVIGLAIFSGYLFCNRKTNEDKKRLQAFESIAASYIQKAEFFNSDISTEVGTTGIGVTKDNDLYIDFTYVERDENQIPSYKHKGRVHFQCDDRDGKVIGIEETPRGCGAAIHWYDPEPYSEEFRTKYEQFQKENEEYVNRIAAAMREYCPKEGEECDLTDEQSAELREKNLQIGKEYEPKTSFEDLYDQLYK